MHTTYTAELARQIVRDRAREAEAARLASKVRGRRWLPRPEAG